MESATTPCPPAPAQRHFIHCNRRQKGLDATGKILRCHSCGSLRHLLAFCPDSWENMEKVKVSKEEVLPKGYSWDGITKLRVIKAE